MNTITSRWHKRTSYLPSPSLSTRRNDDLALVAEEDLFDIDQSDALLLLTQHEPHVAGGRHVEAGYALARGKRLYILGPRENIFYHLPQVWQFSDWNQLLNVLDERD